MQKKSSQNGLQLPNKMPYSKKMQKFEKMQIIIQDSLQESLLQKSSLQKCKKMPIITTLQIFEEEVYQFEEKILEICL
jgi:hypothetical protein